MQVSLHHPIALVTVALFGHAAGTAAAQGVAGVEDSPPTVWYVDAVNAVGFGSGTAADPWPGIGFAVSQPSVLEGDVILVLPGDYLDEAIDFRGKSVTLQSTAGANATRVYGLPAQVNGPTSIALIAAGEDNVVIDGFQFSGGSGSFDCTGFGEVVGGAIAVCGDSTVTVQNSVFVANQAERGGSIYALDSALSLVNCAFLGPGVDALGEALYAKNAELSIRDCSFEDLRLAPQGIPLGKSALVVENSEVDIARTRFLRNSTRLFGAHLWCRNSSVVVSGSSFARSTGYAGSSIAVVGGTLQLLASSVRDAEALSAPGAGLFASGATVSVERCVFERNRVTGAREGGAIALIGSSLSVAGTAFLENRSSVGGAIEVGPGSTATVRDSRFTENHSDFEGSAISAMHGGLDVERCVFLGNDSAAQASGSTIEGAGDVRHSTLSANLAGNGAIHGDFDMTATIAWRNLPVDVVTTGAIVDSIVGSGTFDASLATGLVQSDPLFWGQRDLNLLPPSPAVDALPISYGLDPDGSRREIGAYRFSPFACGAGCAVVGVTQCDGPENSTGNSATLTLIGSNAIQADRLLLAGRDFVPTASAVVIASRSIGLTQLPATNGALCAAPPLVRVSEPGVVTRPDGTFALQIDLTRAPLVNAVGESWSFQVWYRDLSDTTAAAVSGSVRTTLQ